MSDPHELAATGEKPCPLLFNDSIYQIEQSIGDQWWHGGSFKKEDAALWALQSKRLEYPGAHFRLVKVTTQTEVIEA